MESILQEMGKGEVNRQRISYVITAPEQATNVNFIPKGGIDRPGGGFGGVLGEIGREGGFPRGTYDAESNAWIINQPMTVTAPPDSNAAASGCGVYDKIATVAANSIGVASWFMGSDFNEASRATSLTASEPSVKTGKNLQRILAELWEDVAEAEVTMSLEENFPANLLERGIKIHVQLPRCEVRDEAELYDRLHKQMEDNVMSPQHAATEMGDDYEEEQELIAIAKKQGWQLGSTERVMKDELMEKGKPSTFPTGSQELKSVENT
jgi:hypothetical protein